MNRYIADLHFDHKNIIKHCNRPFGSVEEMNETLVKNWNSVTAKDDDVKIVGDFCLDKERARYFLSRLNGRKHLITGNHDKAKGLREIFDSVTVYDKITDGNRKVVLFHYPIAEWDGYYRDTILIYGHIHNNKNKASDIMKNLKNCYNVSADCIGFTPRTLQELITHEKTGKW